MTSWYGLNLFIELETYRIPSNSTTENAKGKIKGRKISRQFPQWFKYTATLLTLLYWCITMP